MYIGWNGQEIEDAEGDNMRADAEEEARMRDRYPKVLRDFFDMVKKDQLNAHYCGETLPGATIDDAIKALDAVKAEIIELRDHTCEWSENDYCIYCGIDGRA